MYIFTVCMKTILHVSLFPQYQIYKFPSWSYHGKVPSLVESLLLALNQHMLKSMLMRKLNEHNIPKNPYVV